MQFKQERILQLIIAVLIAAVLLYFGYRMLEKWHQEQIKAAVEIERQEWNQQAEKFIKEIDLLQRQIEAEQRADVPEEKVKSVFGETTADMAPLERKTDCGRLERQVIAFFEYLDEQDYVVAYRFKDPTLTIFQQMLTKASQNMPVNIAETRDILTLLHNMAHFYRTFGKQQCLLIKDAMYHEFDFIEPVLATLFAYFLNSDDCKDLTIKKPSFEVFYNYAGYFLNTIGGRSYLFRRNPRLRILLNYYCVIILDQANQKKVNRYGIDIRPHIDRSIFEFRNHKGLQNQQHYLAVLNQIEARYQSPLLSSP